MQLTEDMSSSSQSHTQLVAVQKLNCWKYPPLGSIMLNTDGSSLGNPGPAGFGAILRSDVGGHDVREFQVLLALLQIYKRSWWLCTKVWIWLGLWERDRWLVAVIPLKLSILFTRALLSFINMVSLCLRSVSVAG